MRLAWSVPHAHMLDSLRMRARSGCGVSFSVPVPDATVEKPLTTAIRVHCKRFFEEKTGSIIIWRANAATCCEEGESGHVAFSTKMRALSTGRGVAGA
eukprot:2186673-Rhodomonas_salina.2